MAKKHFGTKPSTTALWETTKRRSAILAAILGLSRSELLDRLVNQEAERMGVKFPKGA